MRRNEISIDGWAVFLQLTAGWHHSEALLSKSGSAELVRLGYAERSRCSGCNKPTVGLTKSGLAVAAHMPVGEWINRWIDGSNIAN